MKFKDSIALFFMILIGCLFLSPALINSIYIMKTKNWIMSEAYITTSEVAYHGVVSSKTGNKTSNTYEYQINYIVDDIEIIGVIFCKIKYDKTILVKYNPKKPEEFVSIDSLLKPNVILAIIGLAIIFSVIIVLIKDYIKKKKMVNI